jgi:hypothetical protein
MNSVVGRAYGMCERMSAEFRDVGRLTEDGLWKQPLSRDITMVFIKSAKVTTVWRHHVVMTS